MEGDSSGYPKSESNSFLVNLPAFSRVFKTTLYTILMENNTKVTKLELS